jgi:hypothetical protein
MKIKVPYLASINNLNDRELVFAHFIYYQLRKHGKATNFYMYGSDVRRLLNKPTATGDHVDSILERLRKVFKIGSLNLTTFRISFIDNKETVATNGSIRVEEVTIENLDAIKIYFYLIGRVTGMDVTYETPKNFKFFQENVNTRFKNKVIDHLYTKDLTI